MSLTYITYADLANDVARLDAMLPRDINGVIGIPRSGMTPAAMFALRRNVQLTELFCYRDSSFPWFIGGNRHSGWDGYPYKILVLDDSIYCGTQMQRARELIQSTCRNFTTPPEFIFAAVYGSDETPPERQADVVARTVPGRRYFEWNLFHHGDTARFMLDLDGVLCADPTCDEVKHPDEYERHLHEAAPLNIPSVKVGAICTNRLEKHRDATEAWLRRYGIQYGQLIMHPAATAEERRGAVYGQWKADRYHKSDCDLFIESCSRQARVIHVISGQPVLCLETGETYG